MTTLWNGHSISILDFHSSFPYFEFYMNDVQKHIIWRVDWYSMKEKCQMKTIMNTFPWLFLCNNFINHLFINESLLSKRKRSYNIEQVTTKKGQQNDNSSYHCKWKYIWFSGIFILRKWFWTHPLKFWWITILSIIKIDFSFE